MKKLVLLFSAFLSFSAYCQDITGEWNGLLDLPGKQLSIILKVSKIEGGFSATLDSPDQGATGIQITSTSYITPVLKFSIAGAKIDYEGVYGEDKIIRGKFTQSGHVFPLEFSRNKIEKTLPKRPQEPLKPYPYISEDITFENKKEAITLAGTLTLPKKVGVFPAVVLISGSGPQNRDEELLGHKPFLVLSDYLTRNGIAVLRFDDRGTGDSKGDYKKATTQNFATDVEAAVNYLKTRKEISKTKIGLIGHSEGGIIAPIVATNIKDIKFIVLLAGTGIPGDELLLLQEGLTKNAAGINEDQIKLSQDFNKGMFEIVKSSPNETELKAKLELYLKEKLSAMPYGEKEEISDAAFIKSIESQILSPWMQYFIKYDPAPILEQVKCPVLALNGEKDLQVPPKENLEAIKNALKKGGNLKVTTKELPGLNHLFQEANTGAPSEYATIEQTFSPVALEVIKNWIGQHLK